MKAFPWILYIDRYHGSARARNTAAAGSMGIFRTAAKSLFNRRNKNMAASGRRTPIGPLVRTASAVKADERIKYPLPFPFYPYMKNRNVSDRNTASAMSVTHALA